MGENIASEENCGGVALCSFFGMGRCLEARARGRGESERGRMVRSGHVAASTICQILHSTSSRHVSLLRQEMARSGKRQTLSKLSELWIGLAELTT